MLRKAWLRLNAVFLGRITDLGMTPDQYVVLRWVVEKGSPGLTQRELSDHMASDPNTIASLLRRMEKAKWIKRRRRKQDRRAKEVTHTQEGLEMFKKARGRALDLEKAVLQSLSSEERDVFLDSLEKVAGRCLKSSSCKDLD